MDKRLIIKTPAQFTNLIALQKAAAEKTLSKQQKNISKYQGTRRINIGH